MTRIPARDTAVVAAGVALLVAFAVPVALPAATHLTNGFSAYYTAGRLLRSGSDAARFYDDAWFQAQTLQLGFANARDIYNVNPPAAALLLWPLVGLTPVEAKEVWTGLNLLFVAMAVLVMTRLGHANVSWGVLALGLVTLFQPLREEIQLGQAYALLLVIEVFFAWAYLSCRGSWAGLALGIMIAFKTAGLALPALLIARRQWRALASTVATIVMVTGLTIPIVGAPAWATYFALLTGVDAHPEIAVTAYQSLPGFALHLFRAEPTWNPSPLFSAPATGTALLVVGVLVLLGITFLATWRAAPAARRCAIAAWSIVSIVLSPASSDYHYTLLLLPIALLLIQWRDRGRDLRWGLVIALGVLLVGAPLPYKSPALAVGSWALLAYPKLYGALVLWGVAVLWMIKYPTWARGQTSQLEDVSQRASNSALGLGANSSNSPLHQRPVQRGKFV